MASRSSLLALPVLGAAAFSLVLAACGSTPDLANWVVSFEGGTAPAGTVVVHTEIRTGGCSGPARFTDDVRMGGMREAVGMSPGALPEGRYGFSAEARNTGCAVLAAGCIDVDVPVTGSIAVVLRPESGAAPCPAAMCSAGVCTTAMMDLGVDLGPLDLGPPPDLGPPMPCAGGEGTACGTAPTDGTCHGGNCCLGCWDGAFCREGTADRACGDVGAACGDCASTAQTCAGQRCVSTPPTVEPRSLALSVRNSFLIPSSNQFASAGSDMYSQRGSPRTAPPVPAEDWSFQTYTGTARFVAVAATQFSAYGLTAEGHLYSWGTNVSGLLGTGSAATTTAQAMPTRVGTSAWRAVDGGNQHVCAIREDGRLACWGDRSDGRVGEGAVMGSASAPVIVGSAFWTAISAGERHTCGVQMDGSLWCWGYNSTGSSPPQTSGQLGVGDTADRAAPTRVGTDNDWRTVSAGVGHTCGVKSSGTLWCWGEQSNWGRLGLGATDPGADVLSPEQVTTPALSWTSVAAGNFHTCGIAGGDLYCWGWGTRGATGTGTTVTEFVPLRIQTGFSEVAVSLDHSCGRATGGDYYCWGRVADGRTGTGVDPAGTDLLVPTAADIR